MSFAKLAIIAKNTGKSIHFGNLHTNIIEGLDMSMARISLIIFAVFIIKVLLVAYIWPFRIAPDPDRPLTWYYPCVCGCLRKRQSIQTT